MVENNGVDYRDDSPLSQSDIDDVNKLVEKDEYSTAGKKIASWINTKLYGKPTRGAMSLWATIIGDSTQKNHQIAKDSATKVDNIEQRFDDQIAGSTNDDEVIDLRHSDMLNKSFVTARKRGDFWDESLKQQGINARWFGAVGDGITDDTDSINAAIKYAKECNVNHIYLPAGKYYITGTNIVVEGYTISGEDRMSTTIVSDTVDPVFTLKNDSKIENLGFHTNKATDNIMLDISKRDDDIAYYNITLERLRFDSIEYINPEHSVLGQWRLNPIYLDLNNVGLWDLTIRDISMQYVNTGLTVDTTNGGWMTGSLFQNIVVKGFARYGLGIISSNNTARQITQCVFSDLDVEVLYETTGEDAAGYIISGVGNDFENLRLFNDGTYSGHAIMLKHYGADDTDEQMPTFGYGATAINRIVGGSLEGDIYDPNNIRDLQHFDHVKLILADKFDTVQAVTVTDNKFPNLLSRNGFRNSIIGDLQYNIPADAVMASGADRFGTYLDIDMGKTDGSFNYEINEARSALSALKDADSYSIGLKYRDLSQDKSSNMSGYLSLGGKDGPSKFIYSFTNPNIQSNLQERSWLYQRDDSYFNEVQGILNNGKSVCKFYLVANSHIRIYGAYLTAGRAIDFSRIQENEVMIHGSTGATPSLVSGLSIDIILGNMIRYAGNYCITSDNRPSGLPSETGNDELLIEIIPSRNSNNGLIRITDVNKNIIYQKVVNNGTASPYLVIK